MRTFDNFLSFGAIAIFATASYSAETKVKAKAKEPKPGDASKTSFCEVIGDPAKSGCNTPDKCAGPKKVEVKDQSDCEKQGGTWKKTEAKK